jgi:ketosteroid isomerase-like protein
MSEHPKGDMASWLYEAGNSGDTDWAADALADEIVWTVPGRGEHAGAHRGKEAVLAFFRRVIPDLESFRIEVHDVVANETHAVALVRYDHRRTGRAFRQLGAEVYHFDAEGKISAFWALIDDTAAFDEFFG